MHISMQSNGAAIKLSDSIVGQICQQLSGHIRSQLDYKNFESDKSLNLLDKYIGTRKVENAWIGMWSRCVFLTRLPNIFYDCSWKKLFACEWKELNSFDFNVTEFVSDIRAAGS